MFQVCDIPLEMYFRDLSNGILRAPEYLKCWLVGQENKFAVVSWLQSMVVKRNAMGKRVRFFFRHVFY